MSDMPSDESAPLAGDEVIGPTPEERRQTMLTWIVVGAVAGVLALRFPEGARSALVFVITLGVLIFVHEWGHYQFARWGGMKVNRFGLGFPPWIYTRRHNGIDYSIGALPIGGMVDIAGLGSEEEMVATAKGEDAATPTRVRNPDAPHGQKQFQDASLGWRFLALFAGPMMNFVFAMAVFVGLSSFVGVIDQERSRVTTKIERARPGSPAEEAGLQSGDRIVSVNGTKTADSGAIVTIVRKGGEAPVTLQVERGGQLISKTLRPRMDESPNERGVFEKHPMIGVEFTQDIVYKRVSLGEGVRNGFLTSVGVSTQILQVIGRAVTFRMSEAERRDVGGPVKIAQVLGETSRKGWQDAVFMAGLLSVNLGLLNLLPFPALDGGRILFLGYELIARKPLDPRKEGLVHMVGMVMLLTFMLFITIRDIWPYIQRNLS